MRRSYLFIAVVNLVESFDLCINFPNLCQHQNYNNVYNQRNNFEMDMPERRGCTTRISHGNERLFEIIANDVAELDNKVKTFCSHHDEETTSKEVYEQNIYKLIISLPNFKENTIEVKFKHRVLYIKAERRQDYKKYENVKVLPELLNTSAAKWYYSNQELTISVPYKVAVPYKEPLNTETLTGCKVFIDSSINNVPKAGPVEAPKS